MAHTFSDLHLKHEELFDITSIVGLYIQNSKFISDKTNYNLTIAYHPTELVPIQTPDGPQYALLRPLRTFNFSSKTSFQYFNLQTLFASSCQSIQIDTDPTKNINLKIKLEKRPRINLRPVVSAFFLYPKFAVSFQVQSLDYKSITSSDFNFSLFDKFCFQIVQKKKGHYNQFSYALLSCFDISKTNLSCAFLHDIDNYFVLRSSSKIRDNARAGVKFSVNQHLNSNMTFGYKIKINKCLVHSTISANGIVKSYIDNEVNDQFHFIMSTSLNHPEKSYHFGVGLSWIQPKENDYE